MSDTNNNTISKVSIDGDKYDLKDKRVQDALYDLSSLLSDNDDVNSVANLLSSDEADKLDEDLTKYLFSFLKMSDGRLVWE